MNDIQEIVKEIKVGNLSRDNDEAYAGGFWDLAGELSHHIEELQEEIYNALWELYETLNQ